MRRFPDLIYRLFLSTFIIGLSSVNIRSATAADVSECTVKGQSDDVVLVICPPDLNQEAWRTAGEDACTLNIGLCNAWIWDDIDKAPQKAPVTDADMSKDKVRQAVAVWVNDEKRLVILDRVNSSK